MGSGAYPILGLALGKWKGESSVITQDDVERAIDYLRDSAVKASKARAEFGYVAEYRKVIKAQIMRENDDKPLGAQEAIAYADPRYTSHLKAIREAEEAAEYHRFMRVAAEAKIEAWRTQCSNERSLGKMT
jgi:hypothetical protein